MLLGGLMGGAALGGTVAWVLSAARTRTALDPVLRDAEARARGAAATVVELRRETAEHQARADAADSDLRRLEGEKAAGAARAAELERGLEEQRRLLEEAKGQLGTTFQALAAEALQRSNEGFLQLATEKLSAERREGSVELAAREQAIAALVSPVKQSLDRFEHQVHALEQVRGDAYVKLTEQVRALADGQKDLSVGNEQLGERAAGAGGAWSLGRDSAAPGDGDRRHDGILRFRRAGDRHDARWSAAAGRGRAPAR